MKNDGVPVLESVAAIFAPICPLFPHTGHYHLAVTVVYEFNGLIEVAVQKRNQPQQSFSLIADAL